MYMLVVVAIWLLSESLVAMLAAWPWKSLSQIQKGRSIYAHRVMVNNLVTKIIFGFLTSLYCQRKYKIGINDLTRNWTCNYFSICKLILLVSISIFSIMESIWQKLKSISIMRLFIPNVEFDFLWAINFSAALWCLCNKYVFEFSALTSTIFVDFAVLSKQKITLSLIFFPVIKMTIKPKHSTPKGS